MQLMKLMKFWLFNAVKEVKTQTQTTCHSPSSLCQSDEEAQFLCLKHRESTVGTANSWNERGKSFTSGLVHFGALFLMFAFQSPLEEASCRELINSS